MLMKRLLPAVLAAALCVSAPAYAVGPLATILISYLKQSIKDQVVAYAKGHVTGALRQDMGMGMPAVGMNPGAMAGTMTPEQMEALSRQQGVSPEAVAMMRSAGLFDTGAKPLTDAEWSEYEGMLKTMASAAGEDDMPDFDSMRATVHGMPQMAGFIRASLNQFREMKREQAEMRKAYEQMPESDRTAVVEEMTKEYRAMPDEYKAGYVRAIGGDIFGLHSDQQARLLAAVR